MGMARFCFAFLVCSVSLSFAQTFESTPPPTTASPTFTCPPCGCAYDDSTFTAAGSCPGCGMPLIPGGERKRVGILIFEGVELLDFAGPGEVFAACGGYETFTVAATTDPIRSQGFVTVTPEYGIADAPRPDILVIPGGHVGNVIDNEVLMAWIKGLASTADHLTSVCNGAFVLAEAGLLDGIEATTHWGSTAGLERRFPNTRVQTGRRFVDAGLIVTSAGVSAGIDMALHVVQKQMGLGVAEWTARYMEYEWKPEPES